MGFSGGGGGGSATPIAFGTFAGRPAASGTNSGTGYYATDTGEIAFSNGAAWNNIKGINVSAGGVTTVVGSTGNAGLEVGQVILNPASATKLQYGGNLDINNAGQGVQVAEGSNAKQGTATLTAGAVTVANTSVTATSRIFVESNTDGGTPGWLRNSGRTAGTSFTITSSSGTDTSTVAYEIFEVG